MPKSVQEHLNLWATPPCDASHRWEIERGRYDVGAREEDASGENGDDEFVYRKREPDPVPPDGFRPTPTTAVTVREEDGAVGCVTKFHGAQAECSMLLDGHEVPRVGMPAWVLKARGLKEGDRFLWAIPPHGDQIRPEDITPLPPLQEEMTAEEKARLEELYAAFEKRLAEDGGNWPEYTGPGT